VISRDADEPRLAYLDEAMPAATETLELAAPLDVSQVFRLSARCEEKKCTHFDGSHCQLAVRIARMVPAGGPRRLRAVPANHDRNERGR